MFSLCCDEIVPNIDGGGGGGSPPSHKCAVKNYVDCLQGTDFGPECGVKISGSWPQSEGWGEPLIQSDILQINREALHQKDKPYDSSLFYYDSSLIYHLRL